MEEQDFEVGDTVKIRKDSMYAHQIQKSGNNGGIITELKYDWYRVDFKNGYKDSYKKCDLTPTKINWKKRYKNG